MIHSKKISIVTAAILSICTITANGDEIKADAICSGKKFIVGMEDKSFEPFYFEENKGFDVELAEKIIEELCPKQKIEPDFNRKNKFEDLFKELANGTFHVVISAISANIPQSGRDIANYSYPYFRDSGLVIAVPKESKIKIEKELEKDWKRGIFGKNVFTQKASSAAVFLKGLKQQLSSPSFDLNEEGASIDEVFNNALTAKHDKKDPMIVLDYPALQYQVSNKFSDWKIVEIKGKKLFLTREDYVVAIKKENRDLIMQVNEIIYKLWEDGTLIKMRKEKLNEKSIEEKSLDYLSSILVLKEFSEKKLKFGLVYNLNLQRNEVDITTRTIKPSLSYRMRDNLFFKE